MEKSDNEAELELGASGGIWKSQSVHQARGFIKKSG